MFNYYWQERSFYYRTIEEIENHLNRLNEIIAKSDEYDHFYQTNNFLKFPWGRHNTIGDVLFQKLDDEQLKRRIVPHILQRFTSVKESYVEYNQMREKYPNYFNAFLVAKLVNGRGAICFLENTIDYKKFRSSCLDNTVNAQNIETYHHIVSRQVIISPPAIEMVKSKGKCARKLFESIKELQKYIDAGNWRGRFDEHDVLQKTTVNVSDESDSVKQNPQLKSYRLFPVPNNGSKYCYLHIKVGGALRFVIYPDEREKKIYIVYVGPHLPTKKY